MESICRTNMKTNTVSAPKLPGNDLVGQVPDLHS